MKDYSAAQIKKGYKAHIEQLPREGSKVRELFDLLHLYKGHIIDFGEQGYKKIDKSWNGLQCRILYLNDMYGMDIVHVSKGKYQFVGEYIGATYVTYTTEQPLNIKLKAGKP